MKTRLGILILTVPAAIVLAQPGAEQSWLGNLAPVARSIHRERGFPMAFEARGNLPLEEWRRRGREEIERALAYSPKPVPLDLRVHSTAQRPGYALRVISYAGSAHYRVPAYLLVPDGQGPFPGVVALHDHGGWFFHGKEKLVRMDGEHVALRGFREQYYGGRAWAEELARRGFVVIVPDAFYWGERRLRHDRPPEALSKTIAGIAPESEQYVEAMNRFLRDQVPVMMTWLGFAGTTWMGIVAHDDRRAVDVLASLPEVDADRLACAGLSGGGFRATYMTGLEPRLKASVIVGWMTSLPSILDLPYTSHAALFDAVSAHAHLDHPDIATLGAPGCAVFVQNCSRDRLFPRAGMDAAAEKIRRVYAAIEAIERFQVKFYDAPHQFNEQMQEEAFAWLEKWLRPEGR